MSSVINVGIPREELLAILEMSEKSRSKLPFSADTLEGMRKRVEEYDEWQLQRQLEAMAEADKAVPLLLEAQRLGTYVRTLLVWHDTPSTRYVVAPRNMTIGRSSQVLELRGYPTQIVGRAEDRGWSALGARLRPNGDDRGVVDEREVYRYGGRCENCGKSRDEAASSSCRPQLAHRFYRQLVSATSAA